MARNSKAVKTVSIEILTIGHSTRTAEELIQTLKAHSVTKLVDVRTVPRSRTNPQFNREIFPETLAAAGIGYVHMTELGGLRKTRKDSTNGAWRNLSFRGYADYMQTAEFETGIAKLIEMARDDRLALMCAEAVPWRCHRSLIADALEVRGVRVQEIASKRKLQPHQLTPFARVRGTKIIYPPEAVTGPGTLKPD